MRHPPHDPKLPLLTFPLIVRTWLRIVGVAAIAFVAVEFEKWIRFGRRRGEHAIPAYNVAA